jgi:hypothetical protein
MMWEREALGIAEQESIAARAHFRQRTAMVIQAKIRQFLACYVFLEKTETTRANRKEEIVRLGKKIQSLALTRKSAKERKQLEEGMKQSHKIMHERSLTLERELQNYKHGIVNQNMHHLLNQPGVRSLAGPAGGTETLNAHKAQIKKILTEKTAAINNTNAATPANTTSDTNKIVDSRPVAHDHHHLKRITEAIMYTGHPTKGAKSRGHFPGELSLTTPRQEAAAGEDDRKPDLGEEAALKGNLEDVI